MQECCCKNGKSMPKDHIKYIRRCSPKEQEKFFSVLAKIEVLDLRMLDIKKLQGKKGNIVVVWEE